MSDFIYCLEVSYPTKYGVGKKQFWFVDRREAELFRQSVQVDHCKVYQLIGILPDTSQSAIEKLRNLESITLPKARIY